MVEHYLLVVLKFRSRATYVYIFGGNLTHRVSNRYSSFFIFGRDTMPSGGFCYFCQIKISERMPYACWTKSYFGGEKIVISRNIVHLSFKIQWSKNILNNCLFVCNTMWVKKGWHDAIVLSERFSVLEIKNIHRCPKLTLRGWNVISIDASESV